VASTIGCRVAKETGPWRTAADFNRLLRSAAIIGRCVGRRLGIVGAWQWACWRVKSLRYLVSALDLRLHLQLY